MFVDGTHMKDPPRTQSCHIGVLAKAQFDISEFRNAGQNIVQNVQIFIKSIQTDVPTYVLRRQDFELTPKVTILNL
jgi:hypothetical protein